ncbi:HPr family phosphocarrier protein [Mycoplasmopsis gallopavonis]|uniref:Phosphocarrier, HPr family n=1 Tax=Mycoplasmopsis gallopavonis TaxID=76629 RepID=A0A449AZU1_9BACT|nr:HPr family phosphocarrier protein [Mycoplasmopsis gallopavonis]RIV16903.1 HPr family phosphocarrier protein [Mycoplasmopsis gallopavonis]VEU73017.1 Phosphocarrier, HPr family [Mycoplasmopsis gallopavonis]
MKEITLKIIDPIGIHARPAQLLTAAASKYKSESKIIANGLEANLKSIMNIMTLGVKSGDEVTLKVSGEDEEQAFEELVGVFKANGLSA